MLHTKFQGNWLSGSGEEDFFFVFFTIYGHGGHLGCDLNRIYKLSFPFVWRLHMKLNLNWPSSFRQEVI